MGEGVSKTAHFAMTAKARAKDAVAIYTAATGKILK
jgi:hypothetical protein